MEFFTIWYSTGVVPSQHLASSIFSNFTRYLRFIAIIFKFALSVHLVPTARAYRAG